MSEPLDLAGIEKRLDMGALREGPCEGDDIRALVARVRELEVDVDRMSCAESQRTKCAVCLVEKHTPWRDNGGYVCLTCIVAERDEAKAALAKLQDAARLALGDLRDVNPETSLNPCVDFAVRQLAAALGPVASAPPSEPGAETPKLAMCGCGFFHLPGERCGPY